MSRQVVLQRAGHFYRHSLLMGCAVMMVMPLLDSHAAVARIVEFGLLASVVVTTLGLVLYHSRGLCELCVAQVPLDGPAKAAQWDRSLRICHICGSPRVTLITVVALLVSAIVLDDVIGEMPAAMVVYGSFGWCTLSGLRHDKVQLWCPYCRQRGDGDADPEQDPAKPPGARVPTRRQTYRGLVPGGALKSPCSMSLFSAAAAVPGLWQAGTTQLIERARPVGGESVGASHPDFNTDRRFGT